MPKATVVALRCSVCGRVLDRFTDRPPALADIAAGRTFAVTPLVEPDVHRVDDRREVPPQPDTEWMVQGLFLRTGVVSAHEVKGGRHRVPRGQEWWGRDPTIERPTGVHCDRDVDRLHEMLTMDTIAYACHAKCPRQSAVVLKASDLHARLSAAPADVEV